MNLEPSPEEKLQKLHTDIKFALKVDNPVSSGIISRLCFVTRHFVLIYTKSSSLISQRSLCKSSRTLRSSQTLTVDYFSSYRVLIFRSRTVFVNTSPGIDVFFFFYPSLSRTLKSVYKPWRSSALYKSLLTFCRRTQMLLQHSKRCVSFQECFFIITTISQFCIVLWALVFADPSVQGKQRSYGKGHFSLQHIKTAVYWQDWTWKSKTRSKEPRKQYERGTKHRWTFLRFSISVRNETKFKSHAMHLPLNLLNRFKPGQRWVGGWEKRRLWLGRESKTHRPRQPGWEQISELYQVKIICIYFLLTSVVT